jgi:hypothetical protein
MRKPDASLAESQDCAFFKALFFFWSRILLLPALLLMLEGGLSLKKESWDRGEKGVVGTTTTAAADALRPFFPAGEPKE